MKPRVLLVEDDPTSRAFFLAVLRQLPVAIDAAASCAEALTLAASGPHALWLIDAHLPDGDGGALLPRLRKHDPHAAAVAHTATHDAGTHASLRDAGFAEILVKPLGAATLLAVVTGHLGLAVREMPIWDDTQALKALNDEAAHVEALRKLFLDELPEVRTNVQAALARGDADALAAALHRLNASCGFVGAARLGAAVRALQSTPASATAQAAFDAAIEALL